jgi:hypothetical protein
MAAIKVPHSKNPLSAYCHYPENVKFSEADSEEKIVLLLRKHFLTNVRWIGMSIILIIAPAVIFAFPIFPAIPDRFMIILILFWYLATMAYMLERFITWFYNVYIITDERLFDVDFSNLVYREISEANIDRIEDVTSIIGSVIRTTFNYGDVLIQTSAEVPRIDFEAVPRPDDVAKVLRGLRVEEEQEKLEGRVR